MPDPPDPNLTVKERMEIVEAKLDAQEKELPQSETVVAKLVATTNPEKQRALVDISTPEFSHNDDLPLKIRIAKENWWRRKRLVVTTLEEVWYRDAVTYVLIPPNTVSDLGTIPTPLWWLISPWDIALESLFHDAMYQRQKVFRYVADTSLRSMMEQRGKPWWVVLVVYLGVRLGGGRAWRKHTAENESAKEAKELQNKENNDKLNG